jgi:hypothetical protein
VTKIIAIMAIISLPLIVFLINQYPNRRHIAFVFLAALSLIPNIPTGFIYGWSSWDGIALGFGFPISFIIALALVITTRERISQTQFVSLFLIYFFCIFISIFFSRMWLPSVFVLWQFLTTSTIFLAVAMEAHKSKIRDAVLMGLSLGLVFQAANSILQRAGGAAQASGTFGHQNILGLAVELAWIPILGAALSGRRKRVEYAGIVAGAVCVASSGSRGTMGIAAASVLILIVFSLFRRVTLRKLRAVSAGLILIAVATPFALSSLNSRFQGQTYFVPDLERLRFESAATKMAGENPMGIGANNYVFVSNSEGYADGAGIAWQAANRSVPVHNAYLLARAEMGFFGQIVFVILIVVPCLHGLRSAFKYRRSLDGDIAIGLAVALIANLAHNSYEFAVHTFYVQSLLFIVIGLLSASKRRMRMHDLLRRARLQRGRHLEGQARAVSDHSGS